MECSYTVLMDSTSAGPSTRKPTAHSLSYFSLCTQSAYNETLAYVTWSSDVRGVDTDLPYLICYILVLSLLCCCQNLKI